MVNELLPEQIKLRYGQVAERVHDAARRVGRDPDQINIVVVSKTHSVDVVNAAIKAGVKKFGENYAEEAVSKMDRIGPVEGLEWHMIGHIQSRKAELVSQRFQMVHSLDSKKVAARLDRFAGRDSRILPVLLECNSSGESTKYGWNIEHEELWSSVIVEFIQILEFPNLSVQGLMTMAPYTDDPENARPYFRKLKDFQQILVKRLPASDWKDLSMGMSGDFEVAIEEGATYVRIGQAILGPRI